MLRNYPWPDPPGRQQLVTRSHPGDDPSRAVVLEWEHEDFVAIRRASEEELRLLPEDPEVFTTCGLLDVQVNGYWGRDFQDISLGPEGIRDLCWSILLSGTTCFLPTITTDAAGTMRQAMANIDAACRLYPDVAAMVLGIHQEGPWISPLDGPRGAHPREHVRLPNTAEFERLRQSSGNRIALLTIAPEVDGGIGFIQDVAKRGVTVCLGHHQANAETIRQAVEAGAKGVTHLGNGCSNVMPRHPNLLWEQLAEDRLSAGLIADGHHVPAATAKVFYRAKPRDKLFLVSDAVGMAGSAPGRYRMGDAVVEMSQSGRFGFVDSPTLIGAAVSLARCLANFAKFVGEGKSPADYVDYAVTNPALLTNAPLAAAPLGERGTPATFVVWRWEAGKPDVVPQRIVLRGRTVYDVERLPIEVPFGSTLEPIQPE